MVSPSFDATPLNLVKSLEETLQALARLHAEILRLQSVNGGTSPGFPGFSIAELHHLRAVIRQGGAGITRRLKELSLSSREQASRSRAAEFWRMEAKRLPDETRNDTSVVSAAPPRALLATYRAACRALCGSLQEAQNAADTVTAGVLRGLLQRLEKQLWLLDYSRERIRVGLPTIDLFLSC